MLCSVQIGERLAYLQFFLNQFGPQALPALLRCSHSDLQSLMASLKIQAQNEVSNYCSSFSKLFLHAFARVPGANTLWESELTEILAFWSINLLLECLVQARSSIL